MASPDYRPPLGNLLCNVKSNGKRVQESACRSFAGCEDSLDSLDRKSSTARRRCPSDHRSSSEHRCRSLHSEFADAACAQSVPTFTSLHAHEQTDEMLAHISSTPTDPIAGRTAFHAKPDCRRTRVRRDGSAFAKCSALTTPSPRSRERGDFTNFPLATAAVTVQDEMVHDASHARSAPTDLSWAHRCWLWFVGLSRVLQIFIVVGLASGLAVTITCGTLLLFAE